MSFSKSRNFTITGGTFNVVSGNMTNDSSTHVANYRRGSSTTNNYKGRRRRLSNKIDLGKNGMVKGRMFHGGINVRDHFEERPGNEYHYSSSDEGSETERGVKSYDTAKSSRSEKSNKYVHNTTNNYTGSNVNSLEITVSFNGQIFRAGIYGYRGNRAGEGADKNQLIRFFFTLPPLPREGSRG